MEQAHFCLAATGAGWGVRLKLAVLYGCIPVVIADDVQVRVASSKEPLQVVSAWQLLRLATKCRQQALCLPLQLHKAAGYKA